jgi:PadR family transcriptional regulator PadR
MSTKRGSVLRGTADLLILRTLELEPRHGVAIAERIEQLTRGEFSLGPGSLFPALHRLEQRGWLQGEWAETEEGRRARFYRLTPAGRAQLRREKCEWARVVAAMKHVLDG